VICIVAAFVSRRSLRSFVLLGCVTRLSVLDFPNSLHCARVVVLWKWLLCDLNGFLAKSHQIVFLSDCLFLLPIATPLHAARCAWSLGTPVFSFRESCRCIPSFPNFFVLLLSRGQLFLAAAARHLGLDPGQGEERSRNFTPTIHFLFPPGYVVRTAFP